jgi:hypothetical protein
LIGHHDRNSKGTIKRRFAGGLHLQPCKRMAASFCGGATGIASVNEDLDKVNRTSVVSLSVA